jgi:hypothetical protein
MAEKRSTHLRVVRTERTMAPSRDVAREDYWTQLRALRDERHRLQAG